MGENKPKRILHIIGKMSCDGAETFIMNVYRNIDRVNIQFDFVVHTKEEQFYDKEIKQLGGKIYQLPRMAKHPWKYFKALDKILKTKQYNIIHRHTATNLIFPELIIAKKNQIKKIIVHSHNTYAAHPILNKLFRPIVNSLTTDKLACGQNAGKWLFGKRESFKVIPNGIDFKKFKYDEIVANKQRKELNIEDKFVIGHVGRFNKQKNHMFLIDIFQEICKKKENAILLLIGVGELEKDIKQKIEEKGLNSKVIFLGNRDNVNELMQAMDILIFPSLYEGLPLVLLESQASGLKSIITDTITDEVEYSKGLIQRISLNKTAEEWADNALEQKQINRKYYNDIAMQSKFDIHNAIRDIENIYIKE